MIRPNVFEFDDYKRLLKDSAKVNKDRSGYLRELSEAAGCQRSYFSSVLHTKNHLTPDHACALARFWDLPELDAEYFMALVDLARTGTSLLRERLERKIRNLKKQHDDLGKRLDRPSIPDSSEAKLIYYSSWIYSAIHILSSIPTMQKPAAIAEKLHLPIDQVRAALLVLQQMGLVEKSGDRWKHASGSIHVAKNSPLVNLHHNNWRQQAVLSAQRSPDEGVHYTGVTAMSGQAFARLRELFLKHIDQCNQIAGPSDSEELVVLNLDLFKM